MKIDTKKETKKVSDVSVSVARKETSDAYKLCVKGDALRLANLHQESVSKYLQSIMLNRMNPDSYYGLGVSYKYLGNYEKAIECLLKSVEQDNQKFDTFYELGICHLLDGKPECAIEYLIRAILLDSENPDVQIQLALAHELVGEEDLAMLIYDKLIETKPAYLKAYSHKAALLICQGKYFEASKLFFTILKKNPNYHKAYLGMGVCLENLHKRADAKRYYKKYLDKKPHSKHAEFVQSKLNNLRKSKNITNPIGLRISD